MKKSELPKVSVIIPTYNRASVINRAINSVLNQTFQEFEIIIVDDLSEDNTEFVINEYSDRRISYIKHKSNKGGASARNTGINCAANSCSYIAFLDSDDEWKNDHLECKISLIENNKCQGAFGAFDIVDRGYIIKGNLGIKKKDMSIADYILSKHGGARTSTFVFERNAIKDVMFDDLLLKHQDWDLMIRFSKNFDVCIDYRSTVLIHIYEKNRMSFNVNHQATKRFLYKHESSISSRILTRHYLRLALNTLKHEGINEYYFYYSKLTKKNISFSFEQIFYMIIASIPPSLNKYFLKCYYFVKLLKRKLLRM